MKREEKFLIIIGKIWNEKNIDHRSDIYAR